MMMTAEINVYCEDALKCKFFSASRLREKGFIGGPLASMIGLLRWIVFTGNSDRGKDHKVV